MSNNLSFFSLVLSSQSRLVILQYNILNLAVEAHFNVKDEWGRGVEICLHLHLFKSHSL